MAMSDTIAQKIKAELSPQQLDVKDVSEEHAGHAGWDSTASPGALFARERVRKYRDAGGYDNGLLLLHLL